MGRHRDHTLAPLRTPLTALFVTGLIATAAGAQQSAAPLVFDGATVVDVAGGKLISNQRVVIEDNRIRAMGSAGAVTLPNGARVVDAKGKYLIPGLWDMHTHSDRMTSAFYPLFIANGVTGIRDASSSTPLDTLTRWRREILAGTRVGPPRQLLSGQAIDESESCTRGTALHTCVTTGDTADVRKLVDSLKAAGADIIKTYSLSESMYFIVAAAARRAGLPFGGHTSVAARRASDNGAGLIDHTTLNQELTDACLYHDANVADCKPIAEHLARRNTWWVPTWIYPPRIAGHAPSRAIYNRFDAFVHDFWADSGNKVPSLYDYLHRQGTGTGTSSEVPDDGQIAAYYASPIGDSLGYLYVAKHAELPIIAGTDAAGLDEQNLLTVPGGFTLQTELATYGAEGLTPLEALQTATLNPAKFLHATDSLGTVAPGKLADLVLLDANPLADITNTMRIRAVVANGRYYDRAALDQLLVEVRKRR
jgi:hypothetical protein